MRRRELLAGAASLGVVGAGGLVAIRGFPSIGEDTAGETANGVADPNEVETVEARGSEPGTLRVPEPETVYVLDFFATWCTTCRSEMPTFVEAHESVGDRALFLSVTNEAVGRSLSEESLREWWEEYDGNWALGLDPNVELAEAYDGLGYPTTVVLDGSGEVHLHSQGSKDVGEIEAAVDAALDATEG